MSFISYSKNYTKYSVLLKKKKKKPTQPELCAGIVVVPVYREETGLDRLENLPGVT